MGIPMPLWNVNSDLEYWIVFLLAFDIVDNVFMMGNHVSLPNYFARLCHCILLPSFGENIFYIIYLLDFFRFACFEFSCSVWKDLWNSFMWKITRKKGLFWTFFWSWDFITYQLLYLVFNTTWVKIMYFMMKNLVFCSTKYRWKICSIKLIVSNIT